MRWDRGAADGTAVAAGGRDLPPVRPVGPSREDRVRSAPGRLCRSAASATLAARRQTPPAASGHGEGESRRSGPRRRAAPAGRGGAERAPGADPGPAARSSPRCWHPARGERGGGAAGRPRRVPVPLSVSRAVSPARRRVPGGPRGKDLRARPGPCAGEPASPPRAGSRRGIPAPPAPPEPAMRGSSRGPAAAPPGAPLPFLPACRPVPLCPQPRRRLCPTARAGGGFAPAIALGAGRGLLLLPWRSRGALSFVSRAAPEGAGASLGDLLLRISRPAPALALFHLHSSSAGIEASPLRGD